MQNRAYVKRYKSFVKIRKRILNDSAIRKRIARAPESKKVIVRKKREELIIKKRAFDNIYDSSAWELSFLLGAAEFFVPSFPVEIGGKQVIVQKLEPLEISRGNIAVPSQDILRKVSAATYWKAHLAAYILGHSDLKGPNIGVNSKGIIRLFDNESCFNYINDPVPFDIGFNLEFVAQSFDWPQYRRPLDQKTVKVLRDFVQRVAHFEERIKRYALCRPLSFSEQGLLFRLQKVRSFSIKRGVTFRDFFGSLYPRMNLGLDELNRIVGRMLGKKIDHGSSLFFVARRMRLYDLSAKQGQLIERWITTYVR